MSNTNIQCTCIDGEYCEEHWIEAVNYWRWYLGFSVGTASADRETNND